MAESKSEQMAPHETGAQHRFSANIEATLPAKDILAAELGISADRVVRIGRLTPTQRDLYLHYLVNGDSLAFSIAMSVSLGTDIDVTLWQQAISEVTATDDTLRTRFVLHRDQVYQYVDEAVTPHFTYIDLAEHATHSMSLEQVIEAARKVKYDLHRDYLWRSILVRGSDNQYTAIIAMAHILMDGMSGGNFFERTISAYEALLSGRRVPQDTKPSFYDYIDESLALFDNDETLEYWADKLSAGPVLLGTTDACGTTQLISEVTSLPQSTVARSIEYCRSHGYSPPTYFRALYILLLRHLSGTTQSMTLYEVRGGRTVEHRSTIGCFYHVVPIHVPEHVPGNESSIEELLHYARDYRSQLGSKQYISVLQQRRFAQEGTVRFYFNYYNFPRMSSALVDSEVRAYDAYEEGEVHLAVVFQEDSLQLRLYHHDSRLTNLRLTERLLHLSDQVLDGATALSELSILLPAERQQILGEWNATKVDYGAELTVPDLIERQVEDTPARIAVKFESEQLTYVDLNARSNQLAHFLHSLGIGSESFVGIYMERSLELVVALLGVLKAGAAYVPLDPTYPEERLRFMIEDSGVTLVLTQDHLVEGLKSSNIHLTMVSLDSDEVRLSEFPMDNPHRTTEATSAAYMIYTSGSTGQPKGVINTCHGIANRLQWMQDAYKLTVRDRVLQKTPFSFDVSVWEFFWPLMTGATLVVSRPGGHQDPEYLAQTIIEEGITTAHFVPSMLHAFLSYLASARLPVGTSLRQVICSGEELGFELQQRFFSALPGVALYNLYGPTECAVDVTAWACPQDDDSRPVPIGYPIANIRVYILDSRMHPVPAGITGELFIAGVGLGRGYQRQPGLTAERFIPDPLTESPGARMYRTGDLARWGADGSIEYRGRIDSQVKIRGFRIELGEIEAVLRQYPSIQEAVAVVSGDSPDDKHLRAYLVVKPSETPFSLVDLNNFLKARLPAYMVPVAFQLIDTLPLSPNGKIDRQALPAPDGQKRRLGGTFLPPTSPIEQTLAEIWKDVLKTSEISIDDNFFELGGHSLAATQVVARVRAVLAVDLSVRSLFDNPTVAGLAAAVTAISREPGKHTTLQLVSRADDLPLSYSQEQVWIINQLSPGNVAYNANFFIRFKGQLNIPVLEQTLSEMVRRHEILRTAFPTRDGRPVQKVNPPYSVTLPIVDVSSVAESEREAVVERLMGAEFAKPFDLEAGNLIRWRLLRLSEDEHMLLQVEHHLVHDGWSLSLLFNEIKVLYTEFSVGRPSPLSEPAVQYADFAMWQRQWMDGEVLESFLSYWRQQLSGAPSLLELPSDHPRPQVPSLKGAVHRMEISSQLCNSLKAISQHEGATLYMALLAAFKTLLYRYTRQEDLIVGSAVANRRLRETEGVLGMFVNPVMLRTEMSGNPTFRELLKRIRKTALEAFAHQDLPFGKLVEELQPQRDLRYNPIFQVMFSFHDSQIPQLDLPGVTGIIYYPHNGTSKFDLCVTAVPRTQLHAGITPKVGGDSMSIVWEYSTDLFEQSTISQMVRHYEVLLEAIIADPDQPLSDIALLTEGEYQRVIVEWNEQELHYAQDLYIHQLFEAQVERTPEAIAIVAEDEQLTYQVLDERANRLAHLLRGMGVGPGTFVGIYAERSIDLVVAMLGTLKAGGAYVPLDPSYPAKRIAYMLANSRISVLLTQNHLAPLPTHQARAVYLGPQMYARADLPLDNLTTQVSSQDVAYVLYTSGSTGAPKGVMISHGAILNHMSWMQSNFPLSHTDRVLQKTAFSFDASVWEFYLPLITGTQLVLARPGAHQDLDYLIDSIIEQQITVLQVVPTLLHMLVEHPHLQDCTSLRYLFCGGELLSTELANRFASTLPATHLYNLYGPTEATIDATCWQYEPHVNSPHAPIGRPIAGVRTYVLDDLMNPVPVGIPGELYIGGAGLAQGYVNEPALTAERFVPDHLGNQAGARLYRTGDLVRYQSDGNLIALGRVDQQVKVRGFRIELQEIEAVLRQHPDVREAAVVVQDYASEDRRLVAFVVMDTAQPVVLRDFLRAKLPEYMVPSAFSFLSALPTTPSGKLDRKALSELQVALPEVRHYVAPRTELEETLADILSEVLRLPGVGIHGNFFDLGGHSLAATRVLSRIRSKLQLEVPLRAFFENPTVAELAVVLEKNRTSPTVADSVCKIVREDEVAYIPQVYHLSEDEVDALLAKLLSNEK